MVQDMIRYDILAQDALRGVIRKVLSEVARTGLPGNHHFFITFMTGAPGVRISSRLREKYPEQMTIILQHQFWEMTVTDTGFEIGLSFGDIPERLSIPYAAIRGFYDPSVNFELEFDVSSAEEEDQITQEPLLRPVVTETPQVFVDAAAQSSEDEQELADADAKPAKSKKKKAAQEDETAESKPSADVVSLDAFRKK